MDYSLIFEDEDYDETYGTYPLQPIDEEYQSIFGTPYDIIGTPPEPEPEPEPEPTAVRQCMECYRIMDISEFPTYMSRNKMYTRSAYYTGSN